MNNHLPPASIEAEKAILGGILFDPKAIIVAKDLLPARAFYLPAHQKIYGAMLELFESGNSTDMMAVSKYLDDRNLFDEVGGMAKISQLLNQTVSAINTDRYCNIVYEKFLFRELIDTGHKIVEYGYDKTAGIDEVLSESQRILGDVIKQKFASQMEDNQKLSCKAFEELDNIQPIYATGFDRLDEMMMGFEPGTLTVLAGRPSMGKSAIALNFVLKHLLLHQKPVAFFSLEMTKMQLQYRLWSQMSVHPNYKNLGIEPLAGKRIRQHRCGKKPLSQEELDKIAKIAVEAGKLPLSINDDRTLNVEGIGANLRNLKNKQRDIGLVVVDYLQMMNGAEGENRSYELGRIARGLYQLSSELEVPILALSQVNRACEARNDKRPMMSDLSQSGILEMVADNIIFCYRDEYYDENTSQNNILELILRKARHGSTGTAKVFFNKEYGKIENLY